MMVHESCVARLGLTLVDDPNPPFFATAVSPRMGSVIAVESRGLRNFACCRAANDTACLPVIDTLLSGANHDMKRLVDL